MSTFLNELNGHYAAEKKSILSLCDKGMSYSLADFAKELGASIPKATRIVTEMVSEGYYGTPGGTRENGVVRRPPRKRVRPESPCRLLRRRARGA